MLHLIFIFSKTECCVLKLLLSTLIAFFSKDNILWYPNDIALSIAHDVNQIPLFQNIRCRTGSHRRGSRLPYGDSMEISAATLNRARSSLNSHGRRDSAYGHHNGNHKHWNVVNNNHVASIHVANSLAINHVAANGMV